MTAEDFQARGTAETRRNTRICRPSSGPSRVVLAAAAFEVEAKKTSLELSVLLRHNNAIPAAILHDR